ncbi:MAG: RNA 2',3'-cyclic phosphodiesterase [Actinomycetota bacterium]|nr:MAG: RNA 2',3'-cyclic phosphodiesterase [Actinomycetota bacterium]
MENKRLFIAVDLPLEVKEAVYELSSRVLEDCDNVRPVKTTNIHVTLKFLGGVPADGIDIVSTAINHAVSFFKSFSFELDGKIDAFPDKKRARTVFTGIGDGRQKLKMLYLSLEDSLERACSQFNIKAGRKDFVAHITLARLRYPEDIREAIRDAGSILPFRINVRAIALFESILDPEGVRYTKLEEFSLK